MKPSNHCKTILLVEDNLADEELTLMAFARSGIKNPIVVARDGQEALDYLFCEGSYQKRNATELPQVILLDLKLPKLNGLEVLKRIRENALTKHVPIVTLTNSTEGQDLHDAYALGTNAYVQKPVDFSKFSNAVNTLGLFWLCLNECPDGCPA